MISVFALPPACFACGGMWQSEGERATCGRCGLLRADAEGLWHGALADYEAARKFALQGRFHEAQVRLAPAEEILRGFALVQTLRTLIAQGLGQTASPMTQAAYEQARQWGQAGEWGQARQAMEAVSEPVATLHWHKLRLLVLAGAGELEQAEHARKQLCELFPTEPDLSRWNFAAPQAAPETVAPTPETAEPVTEPDAQTGVSDTGPNSSPNVKSKPSSSPANPPISWWRTPQWIWGGGAIAGAALATAFAVGQAQQTQPVASSTAPVGTPSSVLARATPVVSPTSTPQAAPLATASVSVLSLPPALQKRWEREQAERQATASEQQARRWMNEATSAFEAKRYQQAETLAQGAFAVGGPNSYLAEDALLLQARAADNQNNPQAHRLYARLADLYPQSEYAPVTLLLASQAAARHGDKASAKQYATRLREHYVASPEARRLGFRE